MDKANPYVYGSVRAVGVFRPKFNPKSGSIFSNEINVMGTAFWLKNERVLVTCAHVVQVLINAPVELMGLLVVGKSGQYKRAVVDMIDIQHDLATLKLVDSDGKPIFEQELAVDYATGLDLVKENSPVGTAIAYAGFPMGDKLLNEFHDPTYSEGIIGVQKRVDGQRKNIQISGTVIGGFSGSPVVLKDDTTKFMGVVANGPTVNGVSPGIFMATSWEHVVKLAELANS